MGFLEASPWVSINPLLSRLNCGNNGGNTLIGGTESLKLSATRVRALRDPGRYSDGDGLHLFIKKSGRKSWVQRVTIDGRRRDVGLGAFPAISLAQARKLASDNREAIGNGRDPVAEKRRPSTPTFAEAARAVHKPTSLVGETEATLGPGFRLSNDTPSPRSAASLSTRSAAPTCWPSSHPYGL